MRVIVAGPSGAGASRITPVLIALLMAAPGELLGVQELGGGAGIEGRVTEARLGQPVGGAEVLVEGLELRTATDTTGRYVLRDVPAGPRVLLVRHIGYTAARVHLVVPPEGRLLRDIELARSALMLDEIVVTADPMSRARGELATASVIERNAIANQSATSLQGVLELLPGVPLAPPGLDDVQQVSLRAGPVSGGDAAGSGVSAGDLASFGTVIILDGVPLSNNANLQSTGPRGEIAPPSSAGGGIDLRRIPASTLERVEVIRGVPSARYGDLTQGAIIVDTRAGSVRPEAALRYDARTSEAALVAGRELGSRHVLSGAFDVARTQPAPGISDADAVRLSGQVAHRLTAGRLVLDGRLDAFQVLEDNPEQPEVLRGTASRSRDRGLRLSQRARIMLNDGSSFNLIGAVDYAQQRSAVQALRIRGALPFTDRLTEGRSVGRFIGGEYLSRVTLDGDPWLIYARPELVLAPRTFLGMEHSLRFGAELRREWNAGPGFQFDIEFPPQTMFNGIRGFDRPRRFGRIPAVASSAVYVDNQMTRRVLGATVDVQAGIRLDALHDGSSWLAGARDAVVQPRATLQVSPVWWVRFRGGAGRTAKLPAISSLSPPPQYYDVVNVNWFPLDPAERLAVLTTFIEDPTNPELGFSTARKLEAGAELSLGRSGSFVGFVLFADALHEGIGMVADPTFLLRERFAFADSTPGTGMPPQTIEPAQFVDTIPILVDRPANNLEMSSRGWELSAALPEVPGLRTRLDVQAASVKTTLSRDDVVYGAATRFAEFQTDPRIARRPYWEGAERTGERLIATYRLVHHRAELGLVLTLTVQHILRESRQDVGATDSLSFAGYVTRQGELVPVPPERRADPEFADLRITRPGLLTDPRGAPADWLLNLQLAKTLPLDGRLTFYAFNAFDRTGRFDDAGVVPRAFPSTRFGLDVTLALDALWPR